jgi:hypothetical protein
MRATNTVSIAISHSRLGEPYAGGVELAVPDPPLSDGVVALRVPSEQDLPAIERRIVDPDVVRWIGPSEHTARELLELNWTRWTRGTGATFSVCDPNDACLGHVWRCLLVGPCRPRLGRDEIALRGGPMFVNVA